MYLLCWSPASGHQLLAGIHLKLSTFTLNWIDHVFGGLLDVGKRRRVGTVHLRAPAPRRKTFLVHWRLQITIIYFGTSYAWIKIELLWPTGKSCWLELGASTYGSDIHFSFLDLIGWLSWLTMKMQFRCCSIFVSIARKQRAQARSIITF